MLTYAACSVLLAGQVLAQESTGVARTFPLIVNAGSPLRLYLTKRIPKRAGAPVEAKLLVPLYAFDREVIPAGAVVTGRVSRLEPVEKWLRIRAVLGGDFTPLHVALVEFTAITLADGRQLPLHTGATAGLNSLFSPTALKRRAANANGPEGMIDRGKRALHEQLDVQLARVRSIPEIVRGPDKKELFYEMALSKLPYHPQFVRRKTRFDAGLLESLRFGSAAMTTQSLSGFGGQPEPGTVAHARLLTWLDSRTSKPGEKVEAVLTEPVFSRDHQLVLPEGTRVGGTVLYAKKAGYFHRGGQLRFNFNEVHLPADSTQMAQGPGAGFKTEASLQAAESDRSPFQVDSEGGVKATVSKTRFLALAAALIITRSASDTDSDSSNLSGSRPKQNQNVAGRTLGGGLGFGMLGSIAAQTTPLVGRVLSYYGLAWSLYDNLIARGAEVQFPVNAAIDLGFNKRGRAR